MIMNEDNGPRRSNVLVSSIRSPSVPPKALTALSPSFQPSHSPAGSNSTVRPIKRRLLSTSALDKISAAAEDPTCHVKSVGFTADSTPTSTPVGGKTHKKRAKSSGNGSIDLDSRHRRSGSDGQSKLPKQKHLYKTVLCRLWEDTGACRFGDRCHYAHGLADLRPVQKHPKYKTEKCRMFHETGICPFGKDCSFVHGEVDEDEQNFSESSNNVITVTSPASIPPQGNQEVKIDPQCVTNPSTVDEMTKSEAEILSLIDDDQESKVSVRISGSFNVLSGPALVATPVVIPKIKSPWEGRLSFGLEFVSPAAEIKRKPQGNQSADQRAKSKSRDFADRTAAVLPSPIVVSQEWGAIADESDSVFEPASRKRIQVPSSAVIKRPVPKALSDSHRRSFSENLKLLTSTKSSDQ
eukprot:TRINITY_DN11190_c0_g1_i1.p1 TRINITY_DN11190_c0_g1~~TRINITY_DN11190_c0_g1_i1.p1  ORF type:complete len:409 (+),score=74.72 TRINITY_DN11190_c0_g1_i1:835-2061(+)